MRYCSKEVLDDNLKQHCKEVHGKAELVKGQKNVDVQNDLRRTSKEKKKCKSDNGDLESISKSENSTKSLLVIASLTETSSADENRKKIDMILSEI